MSTVDQTQPFADQTKLEHAILTQFPLASIAIDADFKVLYVNPVARDWLGLAEGPVTGENCYHVFPSPLCQTADCPVRRALDQDRTCTALSEVGSGAETTRVMFVAGPLKDEAGKVMGGIEAMIDLSEFAVLDKEIADLARFPDECPSPVMRATREGIILYANQASAPLLESWGTGPGQALPQAQRRAVQEALDSDQTITSETLCRGLIFRLDITPVTDAGYANIHGRDITEEHRAEVERRQISADLERRAEERTAELIRANEALRQQTETVLELSTPVVQLWEGIVLLPLVGVLDTHRAQQMTERLLQAISDTEALVALLDITGVPVIDTSVAQHLLKAVRAARMLGAQVVITGFSPETAQTISRLGIDLGEVRTCGTLRAGVAEALLITGRQFVRP